MVCKYYTTGKMKTQKIETFYSSFFSVPILKSFTQKLLLYLVYLKHRNFVTFTLHLRSQFITLPNPLAPVPYTTPSPLAAGGAVFHTRLWYESPAGPRRNNSYCRIFIKRPLWDGYYITTYMHGEDWNLGWCCKYEHAHQNTW